MQINTHIGAPKRLWHQAKPVTHSFWCRGYRGAKLPSFNERCGLNTMVKRVATGANATAIVHGHTHSGKEETIFGVGNRACIDGNTPPALSRYGLGQYAAQRLLQEADSNSVITMSAVEVYYDKLYDLFNEETLLPDRECDNKGKQIFLWSE